ncbi:rhodanese-like domain-containing protein [Pseudonocardia sp. MH-G8]|uniref:rhodanese-like domain-containing protein n=1 Tax=Pseudonocardia sp. MH-G8 TaxID=1854588 RepID=UPI000BA1704F|nr:rhodanese-like domain-containing protein [Pseudonocardia sp. MH-G8]OZM76385.1 hypothetical protein CFP66_41355 [Pseudonocardia sp. MH-G8]
MLAERPVAVTCGSGYRSSVAASLLAHRGQHDVVNVTGGMTARSNVGYPVEHRRAGVHGPAG